MTPKEVKIQKRRSQHAAEVVQCNITCHYMLCSPLLNVLTRTETVTRLYAVWYRLEKLEPTPAEDAMVEIIDETSVIGAHNGL